MDDSVWVATRLWAAHHSVAVYSTEIGSVGLEITVCRAATRGPSYGDVESSDESELTRDGDSQPIRMPPGVHRPLACLPFTVKQVSIVDRSKSGVNGLRKTASNRSLW